MQIVATTVIFFLITFTMFLKISTIFAFWRIVNSAVVLTKYGPVSGKTEISRNGRAFFAFYAIPFAAPPIGKLRLKVSFHFLFCQKNFAYENVCSLNDPLPIARVLYKTDHARCQFFVIFIGKPIYPPPDTYITPLDYALIRQMHEVNQIIVKVIFVISQEI